MKKRWVAVQWSSGWHTASDLPYVETTTAGAIATLKVLSFPYQVREVFPYKRWRAAAPHKPPRLCWTTPEGHRALQVCQHAKHLLVYVSIPEAARRLVHHGLFEAFDAALRLTGDDAVWSLEELLAPCKKSLKKPRELPSRSAWPAHAKRTKRSKQTKTSSPR